MEKIQVRRGLKVDLPTLDIGEIGFCTDTHETYIGSASGNILVNGGAGGASTLDALTDVDTSTTSPTDGQVLKYNSASGLWKPASDNTGSGGGSTLISSSTVSGISWQASQITVDITTDTLTIANHGLVAGDIVCFGINSDSNEVPKCNQASGTQLYVINPTTNTFQLSATSGGTALDFTTTGSNDYTLYKNTGTSFITFSNVNYRRVMLKIRGNAAGTTGGARVALQRSPLGNSELPLNSTA